MRPANQTSSGITTTMPPTETIICQTGTPPIAIRIGMSVGANSGISDITLISGLSGAAGRIDTPSTYPMIKNISTGVTTEATSSCRETSAATAANARAYATKPSRNHTTSQTIVLAAAEAWID